MEVQLGEGSREPAGRLPGSRVRRFRMAVHQSAMLVASAGRGQGRRLGHANLHQPALSVQDRRARRLARNARASQGIHRIRRAQPGGLLPSRLQSSPGLGRQGRLPQIRRRRQLLLPMGQRQIRRLFKRQPLAGGVRRDRLRAIRREEHRRARGLPLFRRRVSRRPGYVPPLGHFPQDVAPCAA